MHCKKCIVNAQVCVNAYQIKCIKCILNASQMKSQQNAKNKNAHGTSQNAVICRQMHLKGVGQKEHAFRAKRARHPVATRSHSLVTGGNTSYRARRASFLSTSRCTSLRINSRRCSRIRTASVFQYSRFRLLVFPSWLRCSLRQPAPPPYRCCLHPRVVARCVRPALH